MFGCLRAQEISSTIGSKQQPEWVSDVGLSTRQQQRHTIGQSCSCSSTSSRNTGIIKTPMTRCTLQKASSSVSSTKSGAPPLTPSTCRPGGSKLQIHAKKDIASPAIRRRFPRRGSKTAAMIILDCCGQHDGCSKNADLSLQGSPTANHSRPLTGPVTEGHQEADCVLTVPPEDMSSPSSHSVKKPLVTPLATDHYQAACLPLLPEDDAIMMPNESALSSDLTTATNVQLPAFLRQFSTSTNICCLEVPEGLLSQRDQSNYVPAASSRRGSDHLGSDHEEIVSFDNNNT